MLMRTAPSRGHGAGADTRAATNLLASSPIFSAYLLRNSMFAWAIWINHLLMASVMYASQRAVVRSAWPGRGSGHGNQLPRLS